MRRRLRVQFTDKQRQSTARRDISGRETRRYGSAGGGGAAVVVDTVFGTPIALEGVARVKGTSEDHADAKHQHGIFTTLSGKANGTLAYYNNRGYMRVNNTIICITHIE